MEEAGLQTLVTATRLGTQGQVSPQDDGGLGEDFPKHHVCGSRDTRISLHLPGAPMSLSIFLQVPTKGTYFSSAQPQPLSPLLPPSLWWWSLPPTSPRRMWGGCV